MARPMYPLGFAGASRDGDRAALRHLLNRAPALEEEPGRPPMGWPGPWMPDAPLWEQWRNIYAHQSLAELTEEEDLLRADARRLALSDSVDPAVRAIVVMRLSLVEERLANN